MCGQYAHTAAGRTLERLFDFISASLSRRDTSVQLYRMRDTSQFVDPETPRELLSDCGFVYVCNKVVDYCIMKECAGRLWLKRSPINLRLAV